MVDEAVFSVKSQQVGHHGVGYISINIDRCGIESGQSLVERTANPAEEGAAARCMGCDLRLNCC